MMGNVVRTPELLPCDCMGVAVLEYYEDIAGVRCLACNRATDCCHDRVGKGNSATEQAMRAWNAGAAKIWD